MIAATPTSVCIFQKQKCSFIKKKKINNASPIPPLYSIFLNLNSSLIPVIIIFLNKQDET